MLIHVYTGCLLLIIQICGTCGKVVQMKIAGTHVYACRCGIAYVHVHVGRVFGLTIASVCIKEQPISDYLIPGPYAGVQKGGLHMHSEDF